MAKEKEKKEVLEHSPVMLSEVLSNLEIRKKRIVVDATVGLAGHSKAILELMPKNGKLIALDADKEHVKAAKKKLRKYANRVVVIHANFRNLAEKIAEQKCRGIDAILFDLGLASPHVDNPERGFSFLYDGPLDMRFDVSRQLTAAEIVNNYSEKELIRIFQEYGEERFARKIARAITARRKSRKFKTTKELSRVIEKIVRRQGRIHPATRVFQALRIEVNDELSALQEALTQAVALLRKGGRVAVISYHSLEDRIVKRFFREQALTYINLPEEEMTRKLKPTLKIITKKPILPAEEEVRRNPRARSAKLRVAEKI
jgi:16S rRNA (cytosine1402-N4)-methyltransferase